MRIWVNIKSAKQVSHIKIHGEASFSSCLFALNNIFLSSIQSTLLDGLDAEIDALLSQVRNRLLELLYFR